MTRIEDTELLGRGFRWIDGGQATESINAPQLATATDRLLAYGRFSKRRGPHTARVAPIAEQLSSARQVW
jgi:hypothetical protein